MFQPADQAKAYTVARMFIHVYLDSALLPA
jgi:hypothetical protein